MRYENVSPWGAVSDGCIEVGRVHDIFGQRLIIGHASVLKSEIFSTKVFSKWNNFKNRIFRAHLNPQMISFGR